jgi:hypothetical protein
MNMLGKLFGRPKPRRPHPEEMVSLVALLPAYSELTCDIIRERLDGAFPGWFIPPREQGTFVVEGEPPGFQFLINSAIPEATGMFLLLNAPGPYTEVSGFAKTIVDEDIRARAVAQQSWLSVDLIGGGSNEQAYRFIGAALAVLAPDDATFLVHADTFKTIVFDSNVRRLLANNGDPFGLA